MQPWTLPHAIRSFIGHLEGTGRPLNTIESYRLDLLHFARFLEESGMVPSQFTTDRLERRHQEEFRSALSRAGLKPNSKRRKLHTLMRFFTYLHSRGRVDSIMTVKLATPQKVEKIPFVLNFSEVRESIQALREPATPQFAEDEVLARDQHLAWMLLETGALVSEAVEARWEDIDFDRASIRILNRRRTRETNEPMRSVPLSVELISSLKQWAGQRNGREALFQGILKGKLLGRPMTARTAELVLKDLRKRLDSPELTPRQLRHTRIVEWMKQGKDGNWIQERLGLQTQYALKIYLPLVGVLKPASI